METYKAVITKATKQLEYDILCLGEEEILVLSRLIHGYLMSQGVFPESEETKENGNKNRE